MSPDTSRSLRTIDAALLRLRRLWQVPQVVANGQVDAPQPPLSTILVVDAIDRTGAAAGVTDVAAELQVDASTASRLVDRAVDGRYVSRSPSPADRRRTILGLTAMGTGLLEEAVAFRCTYLARVTQQWPQPDLERFALLIDRFATAVAESAAVDGPSS